MTVHDNNSTSNAQKLSGLLKSISLFEAADEEDLALLITNSTTRSVERGDYLMHAGDKAEALFIVLRGKFVVYAHGKAIAEIGPGEPVGELGFFANLTRTADVIATRKSDVLIITREAYDGLLKTSQSLTKAVLASMATRLAGKTSVSGPLRPKSGETIALVAAGGGQMPEEFVLQLEKAASRASGISFRQVRIIRENDLPPGINAGSEAAENWLHEQQSQGKKLLHIGSGDDDSIWNRQIAENCDTVYLTAEKALARRGKVPLSPLEEWLGHERLSSNLHLAIWRDRAERPIRNSANWLNGRQIQLHHHLALDNPADFDRLLRFMTGNALGVVMCGGGAFGTAHLGAIKALKEHGLSIDMYGGTSVGAAMAAALAVGMSPDLVLDLSEDIFIRSKAMSRLTVPIHSVLDHKRFDEQMQKHYGDYRVEDLPVNFFAVATSMTRNDLHLIRRGELWKTVRASSSIPAVFPPVIMDDGEVLIDGALVDNVPINPMRDLKDGPNIILNFKKGEPWRITSDYQRLPGRGETARRMLMKRKGDQRFPSVFSVLSRTMVITARRLLESTDLEDDVLMEIPTLKRMGFLEWKRGREQFNTAYEAMSKALDESRGDTDILEKARMASAILARQEDAN